MTQFVGEATPLRLSEVVPQIIADAPLGVVDLPEGIKRQIVYRRYESQNPGITDIIRGEIWNEQFTAVDQLGLTEDDGCIIDLVGHRVGEVGITDRGEVLSMEQVEMREEANPNVLIQRHSQYAFTIKNIEKTNGPALRFNLLKTAELQKAEKETELVDTLKKVFGQATGESTDISPQKLAEALKSMDPLQRQAMFELAEAEDEHEQELEEEKAQEAVAKSKRK
jgi:hypothetical protein